MRFTRKNWIKFFDGSSKTTTIRLKPQRLGFHNAWAGPYMKPEYLGVFEIYFVSSKLFGALDDADAKNDGFNNRHELKAELKKLNKGITDGTKVYINWIKNPKKGKKSNLK